MKCYRYKSPVGGSKNKTINIFEWAVYSLVTLGAINLGVYGFSRLIGKPFDLFSWMGIGNVIFTIVGIAGVISLIYIFKLMK